ncbi:glycosyl transferase family 2 [Bifidobacterium sp. UTCIF-39]|uniref:glycosyltransferase n=1 Tax=Bifidobacterium sp. UTCIF-39 TaxID=1465359 RepID=UPI00112AE76D|nr:glycosyltransferase [Bifidobacterium sp. UTCIF-39]TPF96196.1 glycosyl transferase family 2 [Bifidobacterium sp. UTCIF-39]
MVDTKSTEPLWETVSRVVYPLKDADQILPLYALDWTQPRLSDAMLDPRVDMKRLDFAGMNQSGYQRLVRRGLSGGMSAGATCNTFTVLGRSAIQIKVGTRTSLCSFFNAFPAGYWRRWTSVDTVRFVAQARGEGRVVAYASNGRGLFSPVGETMVKANRGKAQSIVMDIPMTGLMDGGYFWFDAEASADKPLTVSDAVWQVPKEHHTSEDPTTLSIAIATFNRPSYCLNQLKAISEASELRMRLDTVYCTDQGSDLVKNQVGYAAVAEELGTQLTYIRQRNLGGSGGFSRGMYETVQTGSSDYCLLLDDDAISEPESILRAVQFADYTIKPVLVGGGMLHLDNRTMLYTQGERINWRRMWMQPSQDMGYNHDFAAEPLRDSPDRHQRIDEDFNGWWMCLIPVTVLKTIGLSLPVFIKFDDIEYGLRAKRAGFPTVCLPGVAVWHQAWHGKDPARTWEEYFTERNRWIAALLFQPNAPQSRVLVESLYGDASLGLRFTYSAMAIRHQALRDILRGPQYIVDSFPAKLGEIRELRSRFADAQTSPSFEDFPEPDHENVSPRHRPGTMRERYKGAAKTIIKSVLSNKSYANAERPDVAIPAQDASWTWLAFDGVNSALVTSPDGNSVAWLKRDNVRFRKSMWEGYRLASQLVRDWKRLSAEYRAYDLPSLKTWGRIFAVDKASESKGSKAE